MVTPTPWDKWVHKIVVIPYDQVGFIPVRLDIWVGGCGKDCVRWRGVYCQYFN